MTRKLKCHPDVLLFPSMREDEFELLKRDIEQNGLEVPIKVQDKKKLIIDGRHRYRACCELGIEPKIELVKVTEDQVLRLVVSLNARRRQLSESQRAAIAAEIATAKRGGTGSNQHRRAEVQICTSAEEQSLSEAAESLNVSRRSVAAAKAVKSKFADVWDLIRNDEITISDAYTLRNDLDEVRQEVLNRFYDDKKNGRKPKKLAQYRRDIKREVAKRAVEKAIRTSFSMKINEAVVVQSGDVWQLGRHTLACCDSSTWNAPKAALAFADPPYNIGTATWDFGFQWNHDWLTDKADLVIVTPGDTSFADFLKRTEMPYRCTIAHWIKNGMTKGSMGYGNHIIGAVFCKESTPYKVSAMRNQSYSEGIIRVVEADDIDHPGRKPLDFMIIWIERLTQSGDIIIDPFLGSGTTLIAAEETGRICHGAEINPDYCNFILGRWIRAGKDIPKKVGVLLDI